MIVPFAGSGLELERLRAELGALVRRPGDEVIIADNRRLNAAAVERSDHSPPFSTDHPGVQVCAANQVSTPGFARNCGAGIATGEWLLFIDADTRPCNALLDSYFDPPPLPDTGILAGGIVDVAERPSLTARHSVARSRMSQRMTLRRAGSPYAQTANCAVLRRAFEEVGGFADEARAGEDAELCFALQRAGWRLEERSTAKATHCGRETLGAWLFQQMRHGSGAGWVNRQWPGEFPPPRPRELAERFVRNFGSAIESIAHGDHDAAAFALLDFAGACAFDLGRLVPNRPCKALICVVDRVVSVRP